ncbi:MAG TPA: MFS transporter, partial [Anaerolineae bacterium]|nr:MFS transporter [Anaerolineae bacterium]
MKRKPLSTWQQALLSLFWFSFSVHWTAILIVTMPSQILMMVGDERKGRALGLALLLGAFVSMVAAPVIGAMSDRMHFRWGRRRPWIVVGTLLNCMTLLGLAYLPREGDATSLVPWIIAFMLVEFFNNVASAPYSALIPDVVPSFQRGSASGWLGLMTMVGNFVGGITGLFIGPLGGVIGIYWVIVVVMLLGMVITVASVREPEPPPTEPFRWREFMRGLWISPKDSPDFAWVFLTRLLVFMGVFTVQEFLQYYMRDVIGAPFMLFGAQVATLAEEAVSFFILALLLGAIVSTLVAGVLSDRYGRKRMVYLAGALMGVVVSVFVLFKGNFSLAVVMGIVFGLGYGAYISVDWALATDVLPSMTDYAKDMGIWHVASVLPQVIATPIAGVLLDHFQIIGQQHQIPNLGYAAIFLIA